MPKRKKKRKTHNWKKIGPIVVQQRQQKTPVPYDTIAKQISDLIGHKIGGPLLCTFYSDYINNKKNKYGDSIESKSRAKSKAKSKKIPKISSKKNNRYSLDFKAQVVREYMQNKGQRGSMISLREKYGISPQAVYNWAIDNEVVQLATHEKRFSHKVDNNIENFAVFIKIGNKHIEVPSTFDNETANFICNYLSVTNPETAKRVARFCDSAKSHIKIPVNM